MKKILFSMILVSALCSLSVYAGNLTLRGCWISSVYNLDYPSAPGLSADQLAREADAIVERAKSDGLNALFLQVRPCGDALYPSAVFPWSSYLSGTQGTAPEKQFDALGYFLGKCHAQGISLHAWINPYRITRNAAADRESALSLLSPDHPARTLNDCLLFASDGCLYLDPGQPQARKLILDGIQELLENYELDGIHFDDYFYPSAAFDDSSTFASFGDGMDLASFRCDSVNTLLADTHALCARLRPDAQFGVSPFGIWANVSQDSSGSNTSGGSSLYDHYADSRKWVREELVDYIMPQLYWSIGAEEGEFTELLRWWSSLVEGTRVHLYIGLAAYRSMDASPDSAWADGEELTRQIDLAVADKQASGVVLFRFGSLTSVPLLEQKVAARFTEQRDKYRFPRKYVCVGLTLCDTGSRYVPADETVDLLCDASPGSKVTVKSGKIKVNMEEQTNGEFRGAYIPTAPPEDKVAQTSFLLFTAERNGFVWVRLAAETVTSVRCGAEIALTDVSGTDVSAAHEIRIASHAPCAVTADITGDVLKVSLTPVKTAVLFEDSFFTDIRVDYADGRCTYTLGLPDSGDRWKYRIDWAEDCIRIRIEKNVYD